MPSLVAIDIVAAEIWFYWLKSKIAHAHLNSPLLFISEAHGTWHVILPQTKFQNVDIAFYYAYLGFKLQENS